MSAPDNLSYADALAALEARGRFGIRLGLGRVRALLRELGDPQSRNYSDPYYSYSGSRR